MDELVKDPRDSARIGRPIVLNVNVHVPPTFQTIASVVPRTSGFGGGYRWVARLATDRT